MPDAPLAKTMLAKKKKDLNPYFVSLKHRNIITNHEWET